MDNLFSELGCGIAAPDVLCFDFTLLEGLAHSLGDLVGKHGETQIP